MVIIANKQDLPNALSREDLIRRLDLNRLIKTNNNWFVQAASAVKGEGIFEAMKQMAEMVKEARK